MKKLLVFSSERGEVDFVSIQHMFWLTVSTHSSEDPTDPCWNFRIFRDNSWDQKWSKNLNESSVNHLRILAHLPHGLQMLKQDINSLQSEEEGRNARNHAMSSEHNRQKHIQLNCSFSVGNVRKQSMNKNSCGTHGEIFGIKSRARLAVEDTFN